MRIFKTSSFGWIGLFIFLTAIVSGHILAQEDEPATTPQEEAPQQEVSQQEESPPTTSDKGASPEEAPTVGIGKFFKLPFHVSVSVRGGYDDNVLSLNDSARQGSPFVEGVLSITYNFGNTRTQLGVESHIGLTDYFEDIPDTDFDFHPNLTLTASHKVSPRLTLALTAYLTYQQEPDFTTNDFIGVDQRNGSYFFTSDKLSAAYVWTPRFSTVTSYSLNAIKYDNPGISSFQNRMEHTFGNEFRFLILPTTTVVGEGRYQIIAYEMESAQSPDSMTVYLLGGVDHTFSPRLNLSVRGGVTLRSYDDSSPSPFNPNSSNGGTRLDPYGEGTLNYSFGPHATLGWTLSYSLLEPDILGSPARTVFRTGLTVSYHITPRIVTGLSAVYEHDENEGETIGPFIIQPAFAEDILSISATAHYALNRTWSLELGYDYTNLTSDIVFREYYKNRFYGGVNFQF